MTLYSRGDFPGGLVRAAVLPAVLAACLLAVVAAPRDAGALPVGDLWISEVMYNPGGGGAGDDDGYEWVELFNAGPTDIDLSDYNLGWGGADYTTGVLALSGTLSPGDYFVVGGLDSDASNGNPTYDQPQDFNPDLENGSLFWADGLALFDVTGGPVAPASVPVHAVIYGAFLNLNGLMDETGVPGAVDFFFAPGGSSMEFDGAGWAAQGVPSPGTGGLVHTPEATPSVLLLLGLAGLAVKGTSRRRAAR
jgi:hypothetical protein